MPHPRRVEHTYRRPFEMNSKNMRGMESYLANLKTTGARNNYCAHRLMSRTRAIGDGGRRKGKVTIKDNFFVKYIQLDLTGTRISTFRQPFLAGYWRLRRSPSLIMLLLCKIRTRKECAPFLCSRHFNHHGIFLPFVKSTTTANEEERNCISL